MIDALLNVLARVDALLWGPWTMAFLAGVAVYFTVRSGFFQVTGLRYIVANTLGRLAAGRHRVGGQRMTPFQAAATSLAGTVGMGNMAGVATALSVGGAGAIFWMWVLAFFGMMSKTVEITLGVYYRERGPDGQYRGGPQATIRRGLGWTPLALLFSAGMLINAVFSASMLQSHTVGRALLASYGVNPYVVTAAMAAITALVVLGGVRRIGRVSEALVPFMTVAYILGALVVIGANAAELPGVFGAIVTHAFSPVAGAGGVAGVAVSEAIKQGMARGMLSNEAGMGSAPMVHATAETEHPFQQGVWGAFEVFFDTIVICTLTALAILSTGAMSSGESGIELLLVAFAEVIRSLRRLAHRVGRDRDVLPVHTDRLLRLLRDELRHARGGAVVPRAALDLLATGPTQSALVHLASKCSVETTARIGAQLDAWHPRPSAEARRWSPNRRRRRSWR